MAIHGLDSGTLLNALGAAGKIASNVYGWYSAPGKPLDPQPSTAPIGSTHNKSEFLGKIRDSNIDVGVKQQTTNNYNYSTSKTMLMKYNPYRSARAREGGWIVRRPPPPRIAMGRYIPRPMYRRPYMRPYNRHRALVRRNIQRGGLLGLEHKYLDQDIYRGNATPQSTAHNSTQLTMPSQGDGANARNGNRIVIDAIQLDGRVTLPSTTVAGNMSDVISMCLIVDKQCNATTISSTDPWNENTIYAFRNIASARRYHVIWKQDFAINATSGLSTASNQVEVPVRVDLLKLNIPVMFTSDTGGTFAAIESGGIAFQAVGAKGLAIIGTLTCRIRYYDPS